MLHPPALTHTVAAWVTYGCSLGHLRLQAHGLETCAEAGINGCRCGWFLDDWWDDSLVWLGRSLGYDSLAFHL